MISIQYGGDSIARSLAVLTGTDGLDAQTAEAKAEQYAGDGGRLAVARTGSRTIRLRYAVTGDPEAARASVYQVFEPGKTAVLLITAGRTYQTEATVGAVEVDPWSRSQVMEVTLVCPDPWLYATADRVSEAGSSEWRVTNDGASVGFVAQVGRSGNARIGLNGTEYIRWNASAVLTSSDVLTLDTREGHRDLYIEANGVRTSYAEYITGWDWERIPKGTNLRVRCTAVKGTLTIRERWAGI